MPPLRPLVLGDLRISSPDFPADGPMPDRLSGWHDDEAPRLRVAGAPEGTVELAVVCHDPDAPRPRGFSHWVLYGIAPNATDIDPPDLAGARVGPNDRGEHAWIGPRPPAGHGLHRYYFWVYALSRRVEGEPDLATFIDRYEDAVLEQARVVGTYERPADRD
jgi:Raf kinase inhibitor-like YbhB/YbcL family protein